MEKKKKIPEDKQFIFASWNQGKYCQLSDFHSQTDFFFFFSIREAVSPTKISTDF